MKTTTHLPPARRGPPSWGDGEIRCVGEKLVELISTQDLSMRQCLHDAERLALPETLWFLYGIPRRYVQKLIPQARLACQMRAARQLQELEEHGPMTFAVSGWAQLYEDRRTRRLPRLRAVPVPNHWDSGNYQAMMREPDSAVLFAVWVWILQVASRCKVRGVLVKDSGIPYDAQSLAARVGGEAEWFDRGLAYFQATGWLCQVRSAIDDQGQLQVGRCSIVEDSMQDRGTSDENSRRIVRDSIDNARALFPKNAKNPKAAKSPKADAVPSLNRKAEPEAARPLPKESAAVVTPTLEDVMAFALANGIDPAAASDFVAYFALRKWRNAFGKPIASWRGRLRQWVEDGKRRQEPCPPGPGASPLILSAQGAPTTPTPPKASPAVVQTWIEGMRAVVAEVRQ